MLSHRHLHQVVKTNQQEQFKFLINTQERANDLNFEVDPKWANQLINYPIANATAFVPKTASLEGMNALHLAARYNFTHFIDGLLRLGIDVNTRTIFITNTSKGSQTHPGETALSIAVRNNASGFVRGLLKARANPNLGFNDPTTTPLLFALKNNLMDMARLLLDESFVEHDPNLISEALAFCLHKNDLDMVQRLLFHKPNINAVINNQPLLSLALAHEEVLQHLLRSQPADPVILLALFVQELKAKKENTATLLFDYLGLDALSHIPSAVLKEDRVFLPKLAGTKKAAEEFIKLEGQVKQPHVAPAKLLSHLAQALAHDDSILKVTRAQSITQKIIARLFKTLPLVEFTAALRASLLDKPSTHRNYLLYSIASVLVRQSQFELAKSYVEKMDNMALIEKDHSALKKAVDDLKNRIEDNATQKQKMASFLLFRQSQEQVRNTLVAAPVPSLTMVAQVK